MNYKHVFSIINMGMVVLNKQFKVVEWNRWMALYSGIEPERIKERSVFRFFPSLNNPSFLRNCKSVFAFGNVIFLSQKLHNYLFPFPVKGPRAAEYEHMQQSCTIMPLRGDDNSIGNALVTVQDVTENVALAEKRERLLIELQEALGNVKLLGGLLPICSHCKKIRDDAGYWRQIESYIKDHSEADFSHGICPDCQKKFYADVFEEK